MRNVAVLACFGELPVIVIRFNPFADNEHLATGAYFRDAWSKLRISHGGIEYSGT